MRKLTNEDLIRIVESVINKDIYNNNSPKSTRKINEMNNLDKQKLMKEIVNGQCDRWVFRLNREDGFDMVNDAGIDEVREAIMDIEMVADPLTAIDLRAETVREASGVYGYESRSGCHLKSFAPNEFGTHDTLANAVFAAMQEFKSDLAGVVSYG